MAASDTIEAQGHLIDSGLLSAIFDKIIEFKSSYEILKFDIGRTNDDVSRIQMRLTADAGIIAARDFSLPAIGLVGALNELVMTWSTQPDWEAVVDDVVAEGARFVIAAILPLPADTAGEQSQRVREP